MNDTPVQIHNRHFKHVQVFHMSVVTYPDIFPLSSHLLNIEHDLAVRYSEAMREQTKNTEKTKKWSMQEMGLPVLVNPPTQNVQPREQTRSPATCLPTDC